MARPKVPSRMVAAQVSGNPVPAVTAVAQGSRTVSASSSVFRQNHRPARPTDDRSQIAQRWQIEAYRQVSLCGEARYSVSLFAALASRADIGISEPQASARKAVWADPATARDEIEAFAELAPTVRERKKLIRDYMIHRTIAGECYLIARARRDIDPEYKTRRTDPVWEIVAVTELRRRGEGWQVRVDNDSWIDLSAGDPIIRMWNPDPERRTESWSPIKALLPVLREIEWLTGHIFTQIRSRLMSAGVWFLPENLTFPPPPPEAIDGGEEAMAMMNESELFMAALAASGNYELDLDDVSFPTVVMASPEALAAIDQDKLIKFWSEIDDKAMILRSDNIRRFALGMDLPPEQVLGSSGIAISGSGGSAGSVNHWGEWANEEKTIAGHIEPALDDFVGDLTSQFLRLAVENTPKVIAYDPANLRMKQDRSKEALQLNERGLLKGTTTLRETGFDPEHDMMDEAEFKRWLLTRIAGGSATPDQVQESLRLLGVVLALPLQSDQAEPGTGPGAVQAPAPGQPGRNNPPSLENHPVTGPPQGDHEHRDAPYAIEAPKRRESPLVYTAEHAAAEGLVLRALEKAGNRLLNDGKRGRDRDRSTPPHLAHVASGGAAASEFDFTMLPTVFDGLSTMEQVKIGVALTRYCNRLYAEGEAYTRNGLIAAMRDL